MRIGIGLLILALALLILAVCGALWAAPRGGAGATTTAHPPALERARAQPSEAVPAPAAGAQPK